MIHQEKEFCRAICDKHNCKYHSSHIPEELRAKTPLFYLKGVSGKCPLADKEKNEAKKL